MKRNTLKKIFVTDFRNAWILENNRVFLLSRIVTAIPHSGEITGNIMTTPDEGYPEVW